MPRLLVHVEGRTEEEFVWDLLREHLGGHGYSSVSARLLGNARQRDRRGGIRKWEGIRGQIARHLSEDRGSIAALMVDYYALPEDWPSLKDSRAIPAVERKAEHIESALVASLAQVMGERFHARRFVPLVMMHEFEALLFSEPEKLAASLYSPGLASAFALIRSGFNSPEEINDHYETAPSKRILELMPEYDKAFSGPLAAVEIGLPTMRRECRHFGDWLSRLERIPAELAADR